MRITYKRAIAVREGRTNYSRPKLGKKISSADDVFAELSEYHECEKEHFIAITLDGASRIIATG